MENAIITILCIGMLIFAAQSISESALSTSNQSVNAWKQMEDTARDLSRTHVRGISASTADGVAVDAVVRNDGETKLEDYDEWDVILEYDDASDNLYVARFTYNSGTPGSLSDNEWAVEGVYRDAATATAEQWDPWILNPDEEIKISLKVNPAIRSGSPCLLGISTPNGATATVQFER